MSDVLTEPVAPRRCGIEEVFAGPFIELLTLAPRNPIVRGLILAQTRKQPGPECETFEQLKAWVELNCTKRLSPARAGSGDEAFRIKVEFSETEYGRANYSVRRYGSDEFALDEDEVLNLVRDAIADGDSLTQVVERIGNLIDDDAWGRCDPNLDDYGDYDYDNHDTNSTEDGSVEFAKPQVRERLLQFLRERHPELLEDLT